MKFSFYVVFFFIFTISYSNEKADSSKSRLRANGTISLNSNGIASIPAFSLDNPAIMAEISLRKGRFSYDPVLAYGLDLRPWFIDNWVHYRIVDRPAFEFRTGVNVSTFFSEYNAQDETVLQGQRYYALELTGVYKVSPKSYLLFAYWNDRGQDPGTIKGHFFNFIGERSEINIGKNLLLSAFFQIFYINYTGNNDGLFITPKVSSSVRNIPFTMFFQAIQPLFTNISPSPGFKWNLGISYTL